MSLPSDGSRDGDPRATDQFVETVSTRDGSVTLVGVVHDHPSSKYRVRRILRTVDPDVLALELPPLAVSLFEQYATDTRTPPAFGGEMSAAIQAADVDEVVGVDGPTPRFLACFLGRLLGDRPSPRTAVRALRSLGSATRHAVVCRLAATLARRFDVRLEVDTPVDHDVSRDDPPELQARDERAQVRRARTVMNALDPSTPVSHRKAAREAHMARRLAGFEGDVVAVVGIDHLDTLAERLAG